jgi:serine phosphatase RsbU (regulator of sigma subunit)
LKESEIKRLKNGRELLEQRNRNAIIEKQQAEQQLELLRQKSSADQQQQQIAFLEKDKQLESQKRESERQGEQRKREILEKDKQLADLQAEEEKRRTFFATLGFGIVALFLVLAGYLLIQNNKKNKLLSNKNTKISDQNSELQAQAEELLQNQEEIMAQRDAITEKNEVLSDQNEKIQSSINAAKTIQTAILPYQEKMDKLLKEYFVVFRPRDVVSGDFYWLNHIDNKVIVAAVDCTGHGVPGAFMSMIGNTLLEKIVLVYKISDPAEILEKLHQEVRTILRQQETGNRDGMDLAICLFEKQPDNKTKVYFAGAKRPLLYTEGADTQIFMLKGSRKSIGGEQNEAIAFETQELILPPKSCIYITTDGLADQNDADRVKLGDSKLKYLLSSICQLPMNKQQKAVEEMLNDRQKGTLQRDDILMIGVKMT